MNGETLFISDLHLDPGRPHITQLFLRFLRRRASAADAVYILGDLFEAWIGDDDDSIHSRQVVDGLRTLTDSGVATFVMHGNRDFMLGADFERRSGTRLLADREVVNLYSRPTLLMHGDLLCTDDTEYMKLRATVRDPRWQAGMLDKPLAERMRIAEGMRRQSAQSTAGKPESIMDVNAEAVASAMRNAHVRCLIHGHTHRPAIHDFLLDGEPAQRLVLGDWYEQGSVLCCNADGIALECLQPSMNEPL